MATCLLRGRFKRVNLIGGLLASASLAAPALAHDEPIVIARGGQSPFTLRTLAHHDECIDLLPGDGPFAGMWLADELAFETVIADDPGSDLFRLFAGNQLALRRISFDEGLRVFEPVGFTEILGSDASVFVFPTPPDGNLTIRLLGAADRPGMFEGVFQLTDLSGLHADSEPFTVCFQTVPAPAAGVLPAFMLFATRRRRV